MPGDDLYRDPTLYDLEYQGQVEDVIYYARVGARAGGPVLELGCGTGRITLPMARAGAQITALDNAPPMLDRLRDRLARESASVRDRVEVVQGDFRQLRQPARHALVLLPFNTIHHCQSHHEVLDLLDGVRRALRPGGRLVLDCYLPDPSLYARDPELRYEERIVVHPQTGESMKTWESGSYDPLSQIHEVRYIYRRASGEERTIRLRLRMFYPQELRALFDWAQFRIVHESEDFDGTPLHGSSLKWVIVAEPRA